MQQLKETLAFTFKAASWSQLVECRGQRRRAVQAFSEMRHCDHCSSAHHRILQIHL